MYFDETAVDRKFEFEMDLKTTQVNRNMIFVAGARTAAYIAPLEFESDIDFSLYFNQIITTLETLTLESGHNLTAHLNMIRFYYLITKVTILFNFSLSLFEIG